MYWICISIILSYYLNIYIYIYCSRSKLRTHVRARRVGIILSHAWQYATYISPEEMSRPLLTPWSWQTLWHVSCKSECKPPMNHPISVCPASARVSRVAGRHFLCWCGRRSLSPALPFAPTCAELQKGRHLVTPRHVPNSQEDMPRYAKIHFPCYINLSIHAAHRKKWWLRPWSQDPWRSMRSRALETPRLWHPWAEVARPGQPCDRSMLPECERKTDCKRKDPRPTRST